MRSAVVGATLALFGVLALLSLARKPITTDEVPPIAAGHSCWRTGDFRLNPDHPPLAKLLAGIPLLFLNAVPDTPSTTWWRAAEDQGSAFALDTFFGHPKNMKRHRTLLFWARLPMVLVGMVLCLYLYRTARGGSELARRLEIRETVQAEQALRTARRIVEAGRTRPARPSRNAGPRAAPRVSPRGPTRKPERR